LFSGSSQTNCVVRSESKNFLNAACMSCNSVSKFGNAYINASFNACVPLLGSNCGIPCWSRKTLYIGVERASSSSMISRFLGGNWESIVDIAISYNHERIYGLFIFHIRIASCEVWLRRCKLILCGCVGVLIGNWCLPLSRLGDRLQSVAISLSGTRKTHQKSRKVILSYNRQCASYFAVRL
jgi:hypothetical protein